MKVERINSGIQPNLIEYLGDGTFYYNYDIQVISKAIRDIDNNEPTDYTEYSYIQVREFGVPEYKVLVKDVIRKFISIDEEFDIINSYNKSTLLNEQVNTDDYTNYLELIQTIKNKVKQDLLAINI